MISARDITVTLDGRRILDGVDLTVTRGESVALVGPNGAGKTTLLRCVLGLVRHTGTVEIGGIDAARDPVGARRLIGYVPQVPAFCDDRARDALLFVAALRGIPAADVDRLLSQVGLAEHGHRAVRTFSTGMRQRLSLAAALLGSPPILVLDEATASLDRKGQSEVVTLLGDLRKSGTTILLCSHRAEEVHALATRTVTLEEGRVVPQQAADHASSEHRSVSRARGTLRLVSSGGRS